MLLIVFLVATATYANSQEEPIVLWGIVSLVCCILGGFAGGSFGQITGGVIALGLLQLKLAKFG